MVKCINYYFHHKQKKILKKIASKGLKLKVQELLSLIEKEPLKYPPRFEYLSGNLKSKISRRINKQHRLIYEVFEENKIIKIYRMWTHYE